MYAYYFYKKAVLVFENSFSNPLLPPLRWETVLIIFCKMRNWTHVLFRFVLFYFFFKLSKVILYLVNREGGRIFVFVSVCVLYSFHLFSQELKAVFMGIPEREFSNTQDRLSWERVMGWKSLSEFPLLRVNMVSWSFQVIARFFNTTSLWLSIYGCLWQGLL